MRDVTAGTLNSQFLLQASRIGPEESNSVFISNWWMPLKVCGKSVNILAGDCLVSISVECGDSEQSSQGRPDHQRARLQSHDGQTGRLPSLSLRGGGLRSHPCPPGVHPGGPSGGLCLLRCLHHRRAVAHLEEGWCWAARPPLRVM